MSKKKKKEYIVQYRDHSQYVLITINGVYYLKIMNVLYTCNVYNIVHKLYFIKKKGKLPTSYGRSLWSRFERELDEETKAGETKVQGSGSILAQIWLVHFAALLLVTQPLNEFHWRQKTYFFRAVDSSLGIFRKLFILLS